MKRRLFCALTALVVLYILSQSAPPDLTAASRELVRLHVVADADDDASQALKLEVRDAVLAQTQAPPPTVWPLTAAIFPCAPSWACSTFPTGTTTA